MSRRIIGDSNGHDDLQILFESQVDQSGKKGDTLKIYGCAIVCDEPGINGRSYPKEVLEPEVNRFREEFIKTGRAAAQLNHPRIDQDGDGKDYSIFEMNLMLTCAIIESLEFEGNRLMCKMKVVEEHPAGKALGALIRAGYVPGYSLRGSGSTIPNPNGYTDIANDYRFITVDVVGNPSFDADALITPVIESITTNKNKGKVALMESVDAAIVRGTQRLQIMNTYRSYNVGPLIEALNKGNV